MPGSTGARHRHRYLRGGKNRLRLIATGNMGWGYVKARFDWFTGNINFDLGDIPNPDRISLAIGSQKDGPAKFDDFRAWRWRPSLCNLRE